MNKHITVELDFIPVEERLPEEEGAYFVIHKDHPLSVGGDDVTTDYYEVEGRGPGWCEELNDREAYWSHWAEIPKIEAPQEG
jgi:hypothetical protein